MDEHLQRLFEEHKLSHYTQRLAELGLERIHDLHHIEDADLIHVGMGKIQIRAFEKTHFIVLRIAWLVHIFALRMYGVELYLYGEDVALHKIIAGSSKKEAATI